MNNLVLSETHAGIAALTLNRPERHNSLVPELLRDLLSALDSIPLSDARAVVLQANGRSFSTGGDVRGFYEHRANLQAYSTELVGLLNDAILKMCALRTPVVAAVHGIVTGGSIGFLLASDLVLLAPEVTITPYYASVGYSPDGGWTAMLPAVIGARRAAEALLLDHPITAQEAVAWGLANRIVPADRIREEAHSAASAISHLVPGSIQHSKHLLWGNLPGLASRLEEERRQFVQQIQTPEAQQGMAQFLERSKH